MTLRSQGRLAGLFANWANYAIGTICSAAVFIVLSPGALAHHSFAIYDAGNPRTLTGVVKEFRWANPHSWVMLTVVNENGSTTDWELEQGPINMLSRQGWTPTTLVPGNRISVQSQPLHSGEPGGRFMSFEFTDEGAEQFSGPARAPRGPPPEPVAMASAVARDFNGVWNNANGGIHFDTENSRTRRGQKPPLRPDYMARWEKRWADADAGLATTDPTASCLPPGVPRFLTMVLPGEILQTEQQLNWYAEFGEATMRIYLDGRAPPAELYPTFNGFSTGRWEGNSLVVTTVGLRVDTLVDTTGVPHSDQLTVTMRMTKVTPDFFEVGITLDDPVAFYEPWQTVKRYSRAPAGSYAQEYACLDGNRHRETEDGNIEIVFQ
jgi:hypothetical protein